ncbi:Galactose/lactose metabolism regulatory protein GAL80 [Grifola frondosa]|uniref:Galactose/lactose metabolism regulatory protein GAL80 n=1 Tax=Grifola frondosa TaxID=5627 RepID=A0A1C7MCZ4_GRIFR|nr:Galactose/lactose metabolism regulatory protein GAL80 [Grifola frondosa]
MWDTPGIYKTSFAAPIAISESWCVFISSSIQRHYGQKPFETAGTHHDSDQNRIRRTLEHRVGILCTGTPLLQPPLSAQYAITAVSTTSSQSASASAKKYSELTKRPVKPYHGSTNQIAADPEVDFVVVAIKGPEHKAAVMPAIKHGKDVFVEWPLGTSLQEATEIAEAARRKGVRTMVGAQSWQNPVVKKVREWVSSGKIGKVISATWVGSNPAEIPYWTPFCQERDVYSLDAKSGATAIDVVMAHNLSALIFVLGPLSSVSSTTAQFFHEAKFVDITGKPTGGSVPSNSPDQFAFTGLLKDSGAILTATWRGGITSTTPGDKARPSVLWLIDGDKGHIRIESEAPMGTFMQSFVPEKVILNGKEMKVLEGQDTLGNTGRAFEEFAKGSGGVYPTFDDAVLIQRHVEAIKRVRRKGGESI